MKSIAQGRTYVPLHKPNQIFCGSGLIAVTTGWTPKEKVAKYLDKTEYAVIGALYSPSRGINFLIRNLIANPYLEGLVLLGATKEDENAGSIACLLDFFKRGFSLGRTETKQTCWVIDSAVKGYIDLEVSSDALERLRKHFNEGRLFEMASAESCVSAVRLLNSKLSNSGQTFYWSPTQFPMPNVATTVFPGPLYGHRIEGRTIAETWVKILHRIRKSGKIRPTGYDGQWQELIDLVAVITDEPEEFYFPEPNYLPCDRQGIEQYIPQILKDKPYETGVKYNYAQRMRSWFGHDQIEAVITKLITEVDSASAVINLWDSGGIPHKEFHSASERGNGDSDHQHGGSPCLTNIWVRITGEGELSLTATFRSNDMFGAWVSNAMGLRALQRHILNEYSTRVDCYRRGQITLTHPVDPAAHPNLKMGPLITISQSAHFYEDSFGAVDGLIREKYNRIIQKELRRYHDNCGNFLIETLQKGIKIIQTTPDSGEAVREYLGRDPLGLIREICRDNPAIAPTHIGYLGIELQKALACTESGAIYSQDR